jgi:mRNA interferase YafQ
MNRVKWNTTNANNFFSYVQLLQNGEELPPEANDYQLSGEWKETREFHLGGDLLIIYQTNSRELKLIRIGSHSQLFKKF